MKRNFFFIIVVLLILFVLGRYYHLSNTSKQASSSEPTIIGIYEGTTPCADCEGIKTTLTLQENPPTFTLNMVYIGTTTTFDQEGSWTTTTNSSGETVYVLTPSGANESKMYYLKDENAVTQLDSQMNKIDSSLNFTLQEKK